MLLNSGLRKFKETTWIICPNTKSTKKSLTTSLPTYYSTNQYYTQQDDIYLFARYFFQPFKKHPELYKPLVIAGPPSVGRETLIAKLITEFPHLFEKCPTYTTFPGHKTYKVISKDDFLKKISNGEFMEFCNNFQENYGCTKLDMQNIKEKKKVCIIVVDTDGANRIYTENVEANFLFVYPPSLEMLRERLNTKHLENEEIVKSRMSKGISDMEKANNSFLFKYKITNEKVDEAYEELASICKSIYKEEWK